VQIIYFIYKLYSYVNLTYCSCFQKTKSGITISPRSFSYGLREELLNWPRMVLKIYFTNSLNQLIKQHHQNPNNQEGASLGNQSKFTIATPFEIVRDESTKKAQSN